LSEIYHKGKVLLNQSACMENPWKKLDKYHESCIENGIYLTVNRQHEMTLKFELLDITQLNQIKIIVAIIEL
jgi:hypothetical protein